MRCDYRESTEAVASAGVPIKRDAGVRRCEVRDFFMPNADHFHAGRGRRVGGEAELVRDGTESEDYSIDKGGSSRGGSGGGCARGDCDTGPYCP